MNLKRFDVLFDIRLSVKRLYLFLRGKMTSMSSSFLVSYFIRNEKYRKLKQASLK